MLEEIRIVYRVTIYFNKDLEHILEPIQSKRGQNAPIIVPGFTR